MNANLLFIYNPRSGKAKIRNHLLDIIDIFTKAGYAVTAYPTQGHGDATRVFDRYDERFDLVVCSGGDGTLDEVVKGMIAKDWKTPLGYIPAGTSNDFARSLRISANMRKAAERIIGKDIFRCDLGFFNDVPYVYIAAFGVFTDVAYGTNQDIKNIIGHTAYILEGIRRLPDLQTTRMRVVSAEIDVEEDFLFGMVTNSFSVGGFRHIADKRARLDDGLFEVTLIRRPKNPLELNNIVTALLTRRFHAEGMYWFKTPQVKFSSQTEVAWSLDGEFGGNHMEALIRNDRHALAIIR